MVEKNMVSAQAATTITAFEVKHAVLGLELSETDVALLRYFHFFSQLIPVKSSNFLHVLPKIDIVPTLLELEVEELYNSLEVNDQVIKDMEQTIQNYFTAPQGMTVQFDVREGDILQELLQEVERFAADLAIIGQKSGDGRHAILAKNLARHTKGNVLFVPERAKAKMDSILVPVDFSENSVRALKTALAINQRLKKKANIFALHVFEVPNINAYRISRPREQFNTMIRKNTEAALDGFLDEVCGEQRSEVQAVLIQRDTPRIANYLLEYIQEEDIDFVVMGAKGHSRLHRLFVGSVTERVMNQNKTVATLIVR